MAVLPLPRHAESASTDLAASSLGLDITVLPIEGARTYAPGISMGTVAVFPAFSTPSPAAFAAPARLPLQIIWLFWIAYRFRFCNTWRAWLLPAGAWLNGLTRLCEIERSLVRDSVDPCNLDSENEADQSISYCIIGFHDS